MDMSSEILTRIGCILVMIPIMGFWFNKGSAHEKLKKKYISRDSFSLNLAPLKHKRLGFHCIILIIVFFTAGATILHQTFQVTLEEVLLDTNLRIPLRLSGIKMTEYNLQESASQRQVEQNHGFLLIQDVVLLPDEVLLLVPLSSQKFRFKDKESLQCSFEDNFYTQLKGIEYLDRAQGVAAVRCQAPGQDVQWSAKSVALVDNIHNPVVTETMKVNAVFMNYSQPIEWHHMVYESFITGKDIVLFAKGINHKQGLNVATKDLRCIFNGTIETTVTVSAQEVFRCQHPEEDVLYQLYGSKITLSVHGNPIPSVIYYDMPPSYHRPLRYAHIRTTESKKMKLCACTMVFNVAKFIREWVMYNSHLGVEHFFLYDNNSEDNLEQILESGLSGYNVSRYPWPWAKTQEAGFSHCALMAREKCQWMMYTDVDEFVFSHSWLNKQVGPEVEGIQAVKSNSKALTAGALLNMVMSLSSQRKKPSRISESHIGQVSFKCRNFGPSGLTEHPDRGVTQGYTCRERQEKRFKSILLLEAASPSLLNIIHRFQLKKGYKTLYVKSSMAVINHYKYQAWSEFKVKFKRRVSAYVVDWSESKNPTSQDRTPGLSNKAIQPRDWEHRFCEVNDTSLKDFAIRVFSLVSARSPKCVDATSPMVSNSQLELLMGALSILQSLVSVQTTKEHSEDLL
ncbi:glycosyltransferase family 92 protein RCOM_0530710 [Cryptomeria japonica]|uniref:glycosyltransferase family 92 protein RCOM_0530710 n=1 Tax=Cryptomeria japonica TaxID=3369 RepID=UPI0027D9FAC8|nr:glycosyltransferase family 92 protein RCOM_0530710 [Cryptomeria japonica]XP_057838892.2 glycosyltransferase family 92 protein RCOM_0530710 [Cryptomeria japonica]